MTTHYETLRLKEGVTFSEVRAAYKQLNREFHPDRHPESQKEIYNQKTIEINHAYEELAKIYRKKPASTYKTEENPWEDLFESFSDLNSYNTDSLTSLNDVLFNEVTDGRLTRERLEELLNKGANINYAHKGTGRTVLHQAAFLAGHDFNYYKLPEEVRDSKINIVKMLLEENADPTSSGLWGEAILRSSIGYYKASYRKELVELLVNNGAPICNGKYSAIDNLESVVNNNSDYYKSRQPETFDNYKDVKEIFKDFILSHPEDSCATPEVRKILGISLDEISSGEL